TGGRGLEALRARSHDLAVLVDHLGVGEFVLFGIGVFDVADRTLGVRNVVGNTLVTLGSNAGRPFHRRVDADLGLPIWADLRKVIGEIVGRARSIRTMHDGDCLVGQLAIRIELLYRWIVPGLHFS